MSELPAFLLQDDTGAEYTFPAGRRSIVCFVKEDCPTCNDVMPVLEAVFRDLGDQLDVRIAGQTVEGNRTLTERHGLTVPLLDDSKLAVSFAYDIDTVPSLFVADADGQEDARLVGFVRDEWRALLESIGEVDVDWDALPEWRPGCGSLSVDPIIAERLRAEAENSPLRARRIEVAEQDDEFEFMFDQGFSDGLPLVPPTPERVTRMLETVYDLFCKSQAEG